MKPIQQLITDHIDIWTAAETKRKSGRGRNSGNSENVYGVKKLRELILELAVRGKLILQDPNDEPADVLLARIRDKKAGLISDAKIKKDKPLASLTNEDKPFKLPNGWAHSRLGDVIEIIRGITFPGSEKTKSPEKGRIACLRTTNVQDQITWDDLLYIRQQFVSREDQFLMPQDIVMSMANSKELVGKVALVGNEIHQKTTFGGFLGVLRPFLIDPRFVVTLLRSPHIRNTLIDSASQTTNLANISLAKLKPLFFAIPPLAEQHRIITKVDELMALCDQLEAQHTNAAEAHEKLVGHLLSALTQSQNAEDFNENWQRIAAHFDILFTTESSIDVLKQTLLQLAVMGKLVQQTSNDEPASELVNRIKTEKEKLIAKGIIKKDGALPPENEDEKSYILPIGWQWCQMADICIQITDGTHQTPKYVTSGRPFLSAQNVKPFKFMPDGHKFVSQNDFDSLRKNRVPEKGDILLTRVGAMIGEAAVINTDLEFAFYVSLGLLKMPKKAVISDFIVLWLNSPLGTSMSVRNTLGRGVSAGNLNLSLIRNFLIGLPPEAEQRRIVKKTGELLKLCDQLKSNIITANQLQKNLADALINQATTF